MLFIGHRGSFSGDALAQVVKTRGQQAGINDLHPHMFRHGFAHRWLADGGNEGALQRLGGWKNPRIMARYGAQLAEQRANEEHRQRGLGDRL